MNPERVKHLEFIQNVITRMNTNSFQIKEWSITIFAALLAVFATTEINLLLLVALFPALLFWFLDAYYLSQERKFRGLYNDVADVSDHPNDIKPFAMRPDLYQYGTYSYFSSFFSITILPLYLAMIVIAGGLFVLFEICISTGG